MPRFLKQFIYGFFYLALLGIVLGIFYLALQPSESCFDNIQNQNETGIDCGNVCGIDCELKYIQPLTAFRPSIFKSDSLVSFIVQIRNPNLNYGTDKFEYKINFYDTQDNLLESFDRTSFIYPGETKNIMEVGAGIRGYVNRGEVVVDPKSIDWKHSSQWPKPILETVNIKSVLVENTVAVSGAIKNPSNFLISKIIIGAILKDDWGVLVGMSKTELNNLQPFQESNFQIFIPVSQDVRGRLDLAATEILVEATR